MQDPAIFHPMKPQFLEQEQLKCPRCESTNTKFCYYNNYNLSQPRHFCKNCKRYWTKGGALRNIPVGGGSRKNTKKSSTQKRSSSSSTSSMSSTSATQVPEQKPDPTRKCYPDIDKDRRMFEIPGSFSSLLTSNGHFGNLLEGLNPNISGLKMLQMSELGDDGNVISGTGSKSESDRVPGLEDLRNNNLQSYLGMQSGDSSCWSGSNGCPDLAIYAPGSSYQ